MVDENEIITTPEGAKRESHDGKGRYDLIPRESLHRLAKHYEAGAKKYGDRNWKKGLSKQNCMNSLLRHAFKLNEGWTDEDHAAAVAWNAFAIMYFEEVGGFKATST